MHTVATVGLMVDPRDLGRSLGYRKDPDEPPGKGSFDGPGFDPTIFLYDYVAGGIGLATRLYDERESLLRRTRKLIETCPCEGGCPACIGPDVAGEGVDRGRRKGLVLRLVASAGIAATH